MDELYVETPQWMEILFQKVESEIIRDLEKHSEYFRNLRKKVHRICGENPEFVAIIENQEEQKAMNLSEKEAKKLAELHLAKIEQDDMIKRLFYCRGCRDGVRYAKYVGIEIS